MLEQRWSPSFFASDFDKKEIANKLPSHSVRLKRSLWGYTKKLPDVDIASVAKKVDDNAYKFLDVGTGFAAVGTQFIDKVTATLVEELAYVCWITNDINPDGISEVRFTEDELVFDHFQVWYRYKATSQIPFSFR